MILQEVAKKIARLSEHVDRGDISKLKEIQETVVQMKAPRKMVIHQVKNINCKIFFIGKDYYKFLIKS